MPGENGEFVQISYDNGEASVRTGSVRTKFSGLFHFDNDADSIFLENASSQLISDVPSSFEISGMYYGGHLGFGVVRKLAKGRDFDLYTKLFYTHIDGKFFHPPEFSGGHGLGMPSHAGTRGFAPLSFGAEQHFYVLRFPEIRP
jgi:hypothetical protein